MKKAIIFLSITALIYACSGGNQKKEESSNNAVGDLWKEDSTAKTEKIKPSDDEKGIGKFTNVEVSPNPDKSMALAGNKIYELKCLGCHKLTDEKLVGPGWKDVTLRRKPEWIMNFSTNTDEMLNKDPAAQAMFEECLIRMPNQSLSDADARAVYEFMRQNDGVK